MRSILNASAGIKKFSRRRFLKTSAVGGLIITSGVSLPRHHPIAAAPKKGGTLRIGVGNDASSEDSLDFANTGGGSIMADVAQHLMRAFLVQLDVNSNPEPGLFESWEPTPDAKIWRFKLRKGAEFSNGRPVTLDDVIFSINLHRGEKSKSVAKVLMDPVTEIKKEGDSTVVITLESGNGEFPLYLTDYHFGVVPENAENVMEDVSSGPYVFETFQPGVNFTCKKFSNYWDQNAANFDEVHLIAINDATARISALLTGQVDIINRVESRTATRLADTSGIKVSRTLGRKHFLFAMDTRVKPYSNVDFRRCLKYAVDREQMLKTILNGYGAVGNDHPISSAYKYFDASIPQTEYDPDKASFYLKRSGMEGTSIALSISTAQEYGIETGELFQQQAMKAGIKIDLVREAADGYWVNVWLKKPFYETYWAGRSSVDQMLTTGYSHGAEWNDAHWENERFNMVLNEARAELDEAKRGELYAEAQRLIRDDGGSIIYLFADYVMAHRDTLTNDGAISGSMELDGLRIGERWWFS